MDATPAETALSNKLGAVSVSPKHCCPTCGRPTTPTIHGHPTLCLSCTEREIGESARELAERLFQGLTRNAARKLPHDADGSPLYPGLTYRQWHARNKARGIDLSTGGVVPTTSNDDDA